jgi:hypothetical protein
MLNLSWAEEAAGDLGAGPGRAGAEKGAGKASRNLGKPLLDVMCCFGESRVVRF